jgi:hypothetical protein
MMFDHNIPSLHLSKLRHYTQRDEKLFLSMYTQSAVRVLDHTLTVREMRFVLSKEEISELRTKPLMCTSLLGAAVPQHAVCSFLYLTSVDLDLMWVTIQNLKLDI